MKGVVAERQDVPAGDPEILGLTSDSRDVKNSFLFAALPGLRADGKRFVDDALARGAAAILADEQVSFRRDQPVPVPVITDANPRRALALMAARFHAPQPKCIAAVTGTNGKTSVAVFTRQIWESAGRKAASLGTIGLVAPGIEKPGSLTTPDPVGLARELQALALAGIDHVALEASSHGLDQFRLDGIHLAAAAFTNLTRDHLDYHRDMARYFAAKTRLFGELLPVNGTAVLNTDLAEGRTLLALCRKRGIKVLRFGTGEMADLRLLSAKPQGAGLAIKITVMGAPHALHLPLLGAFQAMNALAALGLAVATGTPMATALDALPRLQGVPGRMEQVATHPTGAPLIVDYAHTPDALETALAALRPHAAGRLVLAFGCGGDRDRGKRPQMGAIAERLADAVIVTDDNPRSEDPASIRREILTACPKAREIGDRRAAIRQAAAMLQAGDLLLIAGKGHERGQIVAGTTLPFEDRIEAQAAIREIGGAA